VSDRREVSADALKFYFENPATIHRASQILAHPTPEAFLWCSDKLRLAPEARNSEGTVARVEEQSCHVGRDFIPDTCCDLKYYNCSYHLPEWGQFFGRILVPCEWWDAGEIPLSDGGHSPMGFLPQLCAAAVVNSDKDAVRGCLFAHLEELKASFAQMRCEYERGGLGFAMYQNPRRAAMNAHRSDVFQVCGQLFNFAPQLPAALRLYGGSDPVVEEARSLWSGSAQRTVH
jgi:hypothetical protein